MSWSDRPAAAELLLDPSPLSPRASPVETLVIGGGVAGYRAALEAARYGRVLVVTKDTLRESNSDYAQGGVAAVLSDDDSLAAHRDETYVIPIFSPHVRSLNLSNATSIVVYEALRQLGRCT